jgi:hypothetical protein
LTVPSVSGSVTLGLPNDFEVSFLPMTLSKFSQAYPDVTLDVQTDLSVNLLRDFKKGLYDLVMLMDEYPNHSFRENEFIANTSPAVTRLLDYLRRGFNALGGGLCVLTPSSRGPGLVDWRSPRAD